MLNSYNLVLSAASIRKYLQYQVRLLLAWDNTLTKDDIGYRVLSVCSIIARKVHYGTFDAWVIYFKAISGSGLAVYIAKANPSTLRELMISVLDSVRDRLDDGAEALLKRVIIESVDESSIYPGPNLDITITRNQPAPSVPDKSVGAKSGASKVPKRAIRPNEGVRFDEATVDKDAVFLKKEEGDAVLEDGYVPLSTRPAKATMKKPTPRATKSNVPSSVSGDAPAVADFIKRNVKGSPDAPTSTTRTVKQSSGEDDVQEVEIISAPERSRGSRILDRMKQR